MRYRSCSGRYEFGPNAVATVTVEERWDVILDHASLRHEVQVRRFFRDGIRDRIPQSVRCCLQVALCLDDPDELES